MTHDHAKRVKIPFELNIVSAKNRRLKRYLQQYVDILAINLNEDENYMVTLRKIGEFIIPGQIV